MPCRRRGAGCVGRCRGWYRDRVGFAVSEARGGAAGSAFRGLFGGDVPADVFPDAGQSAAGQRRAAAKGLERRFVHPQPCRGVHRQRVEHGVECRVAVPRRAQVPGAAALAAVAAEDPAVEAGVALRDLLDGAARDAARGVDGPVRGDGPRGAGFDAPAARAAALLSERRVVGVGLVGEDQLAQQDAGAELRRHEQRLASDPAQSGFRGQLFFGQRRRVGERPAPEPGIRRAQGLEQLCEHGPDGRMIVRRAGVGGDFGAVSGRIALRGGVLVGDGADDGRAGPLDQQPGVETLLGVALHVAQRRLPAARQPCPEPRFALGQVAARRDAAEVEARIGGKFFDVQKVEHAVILSQK